MEDNFDVVYDEFMSNLMHDTTMYDALKIVYERAIQDNTPDTDLEKRLDAMQKEINLLKYKTTLHYI